MSYADRGSLAGLLEAGRPLPVEQVVDLVEQAAAGLAVLHRQGVIHRDIKPQNLLLRSTDSPDRVRLLVADLGVAKAMIHASGLTQVVGTPAYMAPEQATGEGVDARADVHALGAVAYQMLTGRLVREGGLGDLIDARLPEPPSRLAPLPPAVDDVLLRAIDPDRERRWPDVTSLRPGAAPGAAARGRRGVRRRCCARRCRHWRPSPPRHRNRSGPVARPWAPGRCCWSAWSCWRRPSGSPTSS